MRSKAICLSICCLLATFLTSHAAAQVGSYGINYYVFGTQLSDDEPTDGFSYGFGAAIYANTAGDLLAGNFTSPNGPYPLYETYTTSLTYSESFPSLTELFDIFPAGDYSLYITAGNVGADSVTMTVPESDMPNETPYLINGSWSSLQYAPAGVPAPIEWFSWTFPGNMDNHDTLLYIYDYTAPSTVYYNSGNYEPYASDVIPGEAMISGHNFAYTLYYESYNQFANQGFGGAYENVNFFRATSGYYHVKSDIGTVAGTVNLEYGYPVLGEQIDVEIIGSGGVEETQTITLGYFGYYAFTTDIRGEKTITFKGRHWLRKATTADLDFGQDTLDVTLLNGDVDGDNEVTLVDLGILATSFGTAAGDPGFEPNADLDGDTEITIVDYGILAANFGVSGD